jgi:hypothetical protein
MNRRGNDTIMIVVWLVIGLVVAVLLIYAFTNNFSSVTKFNSCLGQNGKCQPTSAPCPADKPAAISTSDCKQANTPGSNEVVPAKCCIQPGG